MKKLIIVCLLPLATYGQDTDKVWQSDTLNIPDKSNIVKVYPVTFISICNALLDAGYDIEAKDNDLQTVTTKPGYYNDKLIIRVKDSTAIIKTFVHTSYAVLRSCYEVKKNGGRKKNTFVYSYLKAVEVARLTGKPYSFGRLPDGQ